MLRSVVTHIAVGLRMRKTFVASMIVAFALAGGLSSGTLGFFVDCPNAGPFCIDGDVPDAGSNETIDPSGNVKELGPDQGKTTKINEVNSATVPMLAKTNPNSSVDLNVVYLDTGKATNGDVWTYFAWKRDSVHGSGFVSLEADVAASDCDYTSDATLLDCNPWANRADGDYLFSWDQQGGSNDIYLRTFNATTQKFETPDSCPDADVTPLGCKLQLANAVAEYTPSLNGGELAINLTGLGIVQPGVCTTLANIIPGTVTGNSDTADYKDVVLAPLSITTCGGITVEKVTQNAAGTVFLDANSTFHYAITGDSSVSLGSNIKAGPLNKVTHADLPSNTNYTLTEDTVATGYTLVSITCDGADANGSTKPFTVSDGHTTVCVITNRQNPNAVTAQTIQHVALRDVMTVSNLLRITGDNPSHFTVDFRLYDSLALCDADTTREGGTAFTGVPLVLTTSDAGSAQTHVAGSGVAKAPGTYFWWAKFSGNKVNGFDINLPKVSGCGAESTTFSFVYQ